MIYLSKQQFKNQTLSCFGKYAGQKKAWKDTYSWQVLGRQREARFELIFSCNQMFNAVMCSVQTGIIFLVFQFAP